MTNKAGEQPTITQSDLADELEAVFKRHSLASSYDIQARVYEVANICLENRKEILNALRTTSLAAQDGLVEAAQNVLKWLQDPQMGTWTYVEGNYFYRDIDAHAKSLTAALSAIKGDKS